MTKELQLMTTDKFGEVEYNIYSDNEEMYMTGEQLGECLGYLNARESINKIVQRNDYLKNPEFSVEVNLTSTDGKRYNTRVYTEDGIYEITMLAKTEVAKRFRMKVRQVLKAVRLGKFSSATDDDIRRLKAQNEAQRLKNRAKELEVRQQKEQLKAQQLQNHAKELEIRQQKAQNEARRMEESAKSRESSEKKAQFDAFMAMAKDKTLSKGAKAEIFAKTYRLISGEDFSDAALSEMFRDTEIAYDKTYAELLELLSGNRDKFDASINSWGKYTEEYIAVISKQFDKICAELKVERLPFLRWLTNHGYAERDAHRHLSNPMRINGTLVRCIVLKL